MKKRKREERLFIKKDNSFIREDVKSESSPFIPDLPVQHIIAGVTCIVLQSVLLAGGGEVAIHIITRKLSLSISG